MPDPVDWPELAAWYDAKQGDDGDLWHRELIDPPLIRLVGDVRGRTVLDLACGNGYLARRFARAGGTVVGTDASAPIIELAKARERQAPLGIAYHVSDAGAMPMLASRSFDLVYSNMALMDMPDVVAPFREVARLLRPGGRFVASICHPCFDVPGAGSWLWERKEFVTTISRRVGRYREPFDTTVPWRVPDRAEFSTRTWHRPLSWYVRELAQAGFAISAMEEPYGSEAFRSASPQGEGIHEVPLHLVFEARPFPAP
ncbi:MAG TPA: class I SAM-dependent methyltransferase [Thermoplasmata archaeon]|jgi:ubiquinone/menaquinone biosynthesis C-methylase UbiE|nr:class I SAM-dependent methyltransferase [Thermoplasmata archaeon]